MAERDVPALNGNEVSWTNTHNDPVLYITWDCVTCRSIAYAEFAGHEGPLACPHCGTTVQVKLEP